jgi:hypothetical protein
MTTATPPTDDDLRGPEVGDDEQLYRCIAYTNWWNEEEQRITSAAFKVPCFSVDVASLAGWPESTLSRFLSVTGLVIIVCCAARLSHAQASGESGTGAILTRLRLALMMLLIGRTHFFRVDNPRKFRGFS